MSADLHHRLDKLKTNMVRAYAARDADGLRAAVAEAWILSRALRRERDIDAIYDFIGVTVTEGLEGGPTFMGELPDAPPASRSPGAGGPDT